MFKKIYNEIEILTITYHSGDLIKKSLSQISRKFKVTVVENSNNTNFKKKIEKNKNVKCILTGSNLGFGTAFNIGARNIKTKYILHINPDAFINNNIIFELYKIANKIKKLGILSPLETEKKSYINKIVDKEFYTVKNIKGFVMLINNYNCIKSNYFDEKIFLYLEEIDLCLRLREKKKLICEVPHIFVKHLGGKSHSKKISKKMEIQRNWHYMWSLFYFNKKHNGVICAYKKTIGKFISSLIKMIFYFIFKKEGFLKYKYRFWGLLNSYLGNKSDFRA